MREVGVGPSGRGLRRFGGVAPAVQTGWDKSYLPRRGILWEVSQMAEMVIADEIRQRMDLIRTNQKRVASEAGLNVTYVRDILKGKSKHPGHGRLKQVFDALDRLEAASGVINPHIQAKRLQAARKATWASVAEATQVLGLAEDWLLSVESGAIPLEPTFILKFCGVARCPIGWIQAGDVAGMMPEMSARIACSHPHLLRDILIGRGSEGER
jgi:transcriptional regulator with XRE-family HTH domain